MDLEEDWELLPDDGYLEKIHADDGGKKNFSRKYRVDPKRVFKTNYFICPSPDFPEIPDPGPGNLIVPVPIDNELVTEAAPVPIELSVVVPSPITQKKIEAPNITDLGAAEEEADPHAVSPVFLNKTKENEFVDMKMDSPKSSSGLGIVLPQTDAAAAAGTFVFESATEAVKMEATKISLQESDSDSKGGKEGVMNIWKWSLNGIGAICSFGVAAATIYIVTFSTQQRNKQQEKNNQKLQFQIFTDEKRMRQAVHHATKMNETMSAAVRGVPMATRAQFTLGGFCDCI